MRRLYHFMRADGILFEYQPSEFRLNIKIRESYETEEKNNNLHIAE